MQAPVYNRILGSAVRFAKALVPAILLLTASARNMHAVGGAWLRDLAGYYVKLGGIWLTAHSQFGTDGLYSPLFSDTLNLRAQGFGATNIAFYAEYGIAPWLTGIVSTQYQVAVRQATFVPTGLDTNQSASGLGDTWLSARMRLLPAGRAVSGALTIGVKIPTGSANQQIAFGTGKVDYEASVAVGSGFAIGDITQGYTQFSAGYRLRTGAGNLVSYQAEAGLDAGPWLALQIVLDGVASEANFDNPQTDPRTALVNDQSFTNLNGALIYKPSDDMEVSVGYGGCLAGRNTLKATSFQIGVAWKK